MLVLDFFDNILDLFYDSNGEINLFAKFVFSVVVVILTKIIVYILTKGFDKLIAKNNRPIEGRQITVTKLLNNTIKYIIYFFCIVAILDIFGVKTDKILATAGIGGVAIGFGAQFIIRDVISGLAIIFENQFKVNDHVMINGIEGIVQELGLRLTKIKGFDGSVHLISNGQINTVTNFSKENQRIEVKMQVPIRYELEKYREIIDEISEELVEKYTDIIEKPKLIGIDKIGVSNMTLTIWGRCKAESQYLYQREIMAKFIQKAKEKSIDLNYYFVAGEEYEIQGK